jgi:glycosyltransferase involved in cell wall biosynthesis/peptidoglycan/xylan/chitin deacetylase (PgdA/CDA1 family)
MKALNAICICGGLGYPNGIASAARITAVGKALKSQGWDFRLLHCGPSPYALDTRKTGVHDEVPFFYMTRVRRPANAFLRALVYLLAIWNLTLKMLALWPQRRQTAVWIYFMGGLLHAYVTGLCRVLGFCTIQELCEWLPGEPGNGRFSNWQHRGQMFKHAAGVLVISKLLEDRVRGIAERVNRDLLVLRVPALVDNAMFAADPAAPQPEISAYFVWSGGGGWIKDVKYIVRAMAAAKRKGFVCRTKIIGPHANSEQAIKTYAVELGVDPNDVVFTGFISAEQVKAEYLSARALLAPLWDDDRSRTRMPNKLGEYLASGRPVISCQVGDVCDLLVHGVDAYLARPADDQDFADQMIAVLQDPQNAETVGVAGQRVALRQLHPKVHRERIAQFFHACLYPAAQRESRPEKARVLLRHAFCCGFAVTLIATGKVRRALRRLQQEGIITSLYFHNPPERLFRRTLQWLQKHDYEMVSEAELAAILDGSKTPARKPVWLSLDDAYREWSKQVIPLAAEFHAPITLFVPSGIVEGSGLFPWLHDRNYPLRSPLDQAPSFQALREAMTMEQLRLAVTIPEIAIGGHTVTHPVVTNFSDPELQFEITQCKNTLEERLGRTVRSFAFPGGAVDPRADHILRSCGYQLAATTEAAFIRRGTNPLRLPRVCIPDGATFPEVICRIAGIWEPAVAKLSIMLRRKRPRALSAQPSAPVQTSEQAVAAPQRS